MDKSKLLMATLTAHLRNYNESHAEMLADYMVTLLENGKGDTIHAELTTFVGLEDAQAIMDWFHTEVHRFGLHTTNPNPLKEKCNNGVGEVGDARTIIQARQSRHQSFYHEEEEDVRPSRGLEELTPEDMQPLRHKPVKCPYLPNCRTPAGTCPYYHPTENCRYFPNCQYGAACLYYHPPQPCRFQDKCKNPTCNYLHSPLYPHPPPPTSHHISTHKSSSMVPCRYGDKCRNENCYFAHSNGQPCRFGAMCTNAGCPFMHPPERLMERQQARYSKINAQCRFGRRCAKADCPFMHEDLNNAVALISSSNKDEQKQVIAQLNK